jgi:very-short-patch-repair endonuclease
VGAGIPEPLLQAVRVGGRATCVSALALQGFWTFPAEELHVAVSRNACRLRTPSDARRRLESGVRVHWHDAGGGGLMLEPIPALEDLIACQPPEIVTIVAGSVLNLQPGLLREWRRLLSNAPPNEWLGRIDGVCESGTESLFWFRMRGYLLPIRRQVLIARMRVDFLIGERLVVEVDGAAYHVDPDRFEADRRRDAQLSRLGYRVLRFSYRQVVHHWAEVEAAVLAAVIRGDHHRA